eukprot:GHVU01101698.1.p1 GENE.GHVU01101698.1~~GHVU01101698.1.p1  ORF type:complete len:207 (-),score=13.28 GHVU01101698.1:169-762(-)
MRTERANIFSEDNSRVQVLLLQTRVASEGLNLHAADRVIIVEPAWNPARDKQAVGRAFRLGQMRDVVAYRLVTAGAIEDNMLRVQFHKHAVTNAAISGQSTGETTRRVFSRDQLREMFRLLEDLESTDRILNATVDTETRKTRHEKIANIINDDVGGVDLNIIGFGDFASWMDASVSTAGGSSSTAEGSSSTQPSSC